MPRDDLETLAIGAFVLLPLAFLLAHDGCEPSRCDPAQPAAIFDPSEESAPLVELSEPVEPEFEKIKSDAEPERMDRPQRVEPVGDDERIDDDELLIMRSAAGRPMFLVYEGELMLASYPDALPGTGKLRARYEEGRFHARQGVADEVLPQAIQQLAGRDFIVYEVGGGTCVARVDGFAMAVEEQGVLWEFGERPSRAELRQHGRESMNNPLALVASLSGARPCGEGIAMPLGGSSARTFVRLDPDAAAAKKLEAQVRRQLSAQPEYAELRRDYREYREGHPDPADAGIETFADYAEHNLEVHRWQQVTGSRSLVVVELLDRTASCGDGFFGSSAWIFEDTDEGLQRLEQAGAHGIEVLVDVDGDGSLQWMTADDTYGRSVALGGCEDDVDVSITLPLQDCPC